jgi:hypothetical protein
MEKCRRNGATERSLEGVCFRLDIDRICRAVSVQRSDVRDEYLGMSTSSTPVELANLDSPFYRWVREPTVSKAL